MPEKEVSGAALKWWDENMHSYAHNFHLALYYGISSCKLQGAMAKKVYNFHFLSSVRKEQNFIGITTHQLGGGASAQQTRMTCFSIKYLLESMRRTLSCSLIMFFNILHHVYE
jgi:hypothetical protein